MFKIFQFKTTRLNGLDHLRAIAILLVMIYHFGKGLPEWLEPVRKIGWTGVDLFFVLSGFLIAFQLIKEYKNNFHIDFKKFYLKRFFRIIPIYLVVLFLYFNIGDQREGNGIPPLWRFLTFTQNFGLDTQTQKSFSHAWSLCVEEQFYLLLPITILLIFKSQIQKTTPYLIIGLVALGFFLRLYTWIEFIQPLIDNREHRQMIQMFLEKLYYPSYNRMDGLLIGAGIAALNNFKTKTSNFLTKHCNFVLIIGIIFLLLSYNICRNILSFNAMIFGLPVVSLSYGIILIGAISPGSILYKLKSKITFIIATLSYSTYLIHKQVYESIKNTIRHSDNAFLQNNTFWICLIVAFTCAFLLHIVIEKPFMKWRQKLLTKQHGCIFRL